VAVAATLLGKESELGTLAPGPTPIWGGMKEDPLKDITATQRVSFVMKEGVVVVPPGH
jgi:imidazolonepropionase-like amidohydrolase